MKAAIPMPPPGTGWRLLSAVCGNLRSQSFIGERPIVVWYWQKETNMNREWASTRKEIFENGVIGSSFLVNAPVAPPGEGWSLRAAITHQNIVIWYWEREVTELVIRSNSTEKETIVIGDETISPNNTETHRPKRR
jgi:hypothetical protein